MVAALITTLIFAHVVSAAPSTNRAINFQGRLLNATGGVVPDGHYNMQFKIYQDGTGTAAGNPGGTLNWTETHVNNGGTDGVEVRNGFFSVSLGSITPFGSSVDWNASTLWLSMNVAGSSTSCSTFGSSPCVADGEMLPMKQVGATPYAISAGSLAGKTADNFIQLAQGVQTDASNNTSSIFLNKTGSGGNFLQLQNAASDILTINNTGNLTLGSNANKSISISTSASDTAGRQLSLTAGTGGSGSGTAGGDLVLQGGAAGGTNGNGGNISIDAGTKTGAGNDGAIAIGTASASAITIGSISSATHQTISIGANNTTGSSANVTVGTGGSASSGSTTIQAKNSVSIATNGQTRATFSDTANVAYLGDGASSAAPSNFTLQATNSSAAAISGGSLTIQGGNATTGNANGGDLVLSGGSSSGSGSNGVVVLTTPTLSTTTNDANCYTNGQRVTASCTLSATSVNSGAAVTVGFSQDGRTVTVPDPSNITAGRLLYVTADTNSNRFTLSLNSGTSTVTMAGGTATALLWNGSDWVVTGTSNASTFSSLTEGPAGTASAVKIGANQSGTTLLMLDQGTGAPATNDTALLGSMYYDTTLGRVQCYEASGWGRCSGSPDSYITLSPQYSNSVTSGAGNGVLGNGFCSDTLNINDGSSSQPSICGTNETRNYYSWIAQGLSGAQTVSFYVTYQLPSTFKSFPSSSISLLGKTDNAASSVKYQPYRSTSSGLTACGSEVTVSSGTQTTWQKGTADVSSCGFTAGDNIVFKISLTANTATNAYLSDLSFAFSNQ